MKITKLLIPFLILISCSQKQNQQEQQCIQENELNTVLDSSVSSLPKPISSAEEDRYSFGYKTKAYRKLRRDSLNRINKLSTLLYKMMEEDADSAIKIYHVISKYRNLKQHENLLISSIRHNNFELIKAVYSDLNKEGMHKFSNEFQINISDRRNPIENCDTTTLKFIFDNHLWSARNRQDSAFRLIRAIDFNRADLLKFYLENGWLSIINTVVLIDDSGDAPFDGYSPLDWALLKSDTAAASLLIRNGAKIDKESLTIFADSIGTKYAFDVLIQLGYKKNEILDSSLWHPTMYGQADKVRTLMKLSANTEEKDLKNNTPIFNTMREFNFPVSDPTLNKLKTLKILIENGANINHQNKKGITPLMYSTIQWTNDGLNVKLGFAKLLLKYGANSDLVDENGNTFWDHIILNHNKIFMEYFNDNDITPEKYRVQFDSLAKTIDININMLYPIYELEN